MLAWRAGRVVAATPEDHVAPTTTRFTAPGDGPLILVWAADRLPRLWRWPSAAPAPTPPANAVDRAVRVEAALRDGDVETAHALLDEAPDKSPAFAALRARLASLDEGLPGPAARDRARAGWTAAQEQAPALAHLELGRLARAAGDVGEARRHLKQVVKLAPDAHEAHLELFRLDLEAGWRDEAGEALAAALRTAPRPCDLVDEQAAFLQGQEDVRGRARLVDTYLDCEKPREAAELLLELGRAADALPRLEALAAEKPDDAKVRQARARALVALGRLDEARALYAQAGDAASALRAADLAGALDPATLPASLRALLAKHPAAHESLDVIAAWPEWSPFARLDLATEKVIADFEAEPPLPGPAVRVLEHTSILYFADGRSLRRVHEILAIRSHEGAETFGEIGLPDGVRLVELYTRKADGRRLYAEESPEKETISMPDLESGDYVVAVYLKAGDNGYLYDRGFLTPRVWFRSTEIPIFRQRFEVFSPDDKPPDVQVLAGAPDPQPVLLDGRAGLRFEARQVPLFPLEADAAPQALWLPSVRAGRGVKLADDVDYVRDRMLGQRRRTARFDAWVAQTAGAGTDRERALRLARAVRERIDDKVGLIDDDAPRMAETGHGNRALVLSAALESAGIAHTLYLGRPAVHDPDGPFPQMADYPYPLIRIGDGWLDPGPDRAPPGFIGHVMLGGDGVQVWPPDAPRAVVALPTDRAVPDRRTVTMKLRWKADGTAEGEVEDVLEGQEAIVIGGYLARLEPDQRPHLMERLLLPVVGAATVTRFDDPVGHQDPDGPLTLRYRFEAKIGDTLDLGLFPVSPGRTWGSLPERRTPLLIELPTDQRATVTVESDRPLTVKPRPGRYAEDRHRYTLDVDPSSDAVTLTAHLVVAGGAIDPAAYLRFAHWAREVDAAERVQLRAAP
jgi:tetratricopeptide (TPR) repeat protein